ncbi:UbiX family flavin prenyltransferase [Thermaurantiacus tibetensis]|nr:UbiX family flavin prenyltransferase [Thermaurantiacus tibetensis]
MSGTPPPRRVVVAITGASGAVYGARLLELLRELGHETHVVVSRAGALALQQELGIEARALGQRSDFFYSAADVGARIASGSFRTHAMAIAPCSIRTLAEIATGVTSSLVTRAADVMLKERRRLVLVVRETPLHTGHIRRMLEASEAGAIILPPVPAFYFHPQTIGQMVDQTVHRILDLMEIAHGFGAAWDGIAPADRAGAGA